MSIRRTGINTFGPGLRGSGLAGGFSWLEAMLTLAVLALGCLAVLGLQKTVLRDEAGLDQVDIVDQLAASCLELIKTQAFADLAALGRQEKVNRYGETCRENRDPICYELDLQISPQSPTSRSCLVSLEVGWQEGRSRRRRHYELVLTDF